MVDTQDFDVERRARRAIARDGLADLFLGVALLAGAALVAWTAYRLRVPRFYVYAGLAVIGMLLPWLFGLDFEYRAVGMTGLPALVMIPWGAVTLARFLREHPKQAEVPDAS
jgi:cyanate permease